MSLREEWEVNELLHIKNFEIFVIKANDCLQDYVNKYFKEIGEKSTNNYVSLPKEYQITRQENEYIKFKCIDTYIWQSYADGRWLVKARQRRFIKILRLKIFLVADYVMVYKIQVTVRTYSATKIK